MGAGGILQAGLGGIGNLMNASAEARENEQLAAQARRNAIRAEYAAMDAEQRGAAEAGKIQMEGSRVIAEGRVATAASGIELDSPVALNVANTTRAYSALDALTAKSNAAREAWGYRQEAEEYRKASKQAKRKSTLTPLSMFTGRSGGL